jgi:TonB family protein
MIVFPQGAVLRMATAVNAGQMVVVTNLKSGQDAICRVLKVRSYAANQSYVEVEFTHRQVGYWGVQFAADATEAAKKAPSPFPAPSRLEKAAADLSRGQAPAPVSTAMPAPAPRVTPIAKVPGASAFASIGTQEEVQSPSAPPSSRAASSSDSAHSPYGNSVVEIDRKARAAESARKSETAVAMPSASHVDEAEPEVQGGDAFPAPSESAQEENAAPALGRFAAGSGTRAASREIFGAQIESEKAAVSGTDSNKSLLVIGSAVAAVVLAAAGYFFFFHHAPPAAAPVAAPVAAVATPAASEAETAASVVAVPAASTTSAPVSRATNGVPAPAPRPASIHEAPAASTKPEASTVDAAQSAPAPAAAEHHSNSAVPSLFGVLNAHPVAPHADSDASQSAPDVDANSLAGSAATGLPAISGNANIPAPPKRVVTEARLISSVSPTYPSMARQMHVEGSVVIDATVQPNGTVGAMKVVSGPQLLRESALGALRQWRYQAATSDGAAVSSEITVTLNFRAQ